MPGGPSSQLASVLSQNLPGIRVNIRDQAEDSVRLTRLSNVRTSTLAGREMTSRKFHLKALFRRCRLTLYYLSWGVRISSSIARALFGPGISLVNAKVGVLL